MKTPYLLTLCLSSFMILAVAYPCQGGDLRLLNMDVHVHHTGTGQLQMDVSLTNISKRSILLYQNDLPWEFRYSLLIIVARSSSGGESLEAQLPVQDPGRSETVELQPGQTIRGKIVLNERFPTLAKETRARDLYVFWVYEVTPKGSSSLERLGGWAFVQKQNVPSASK